MDQDRPKSDSSKITRKLLVVDLFLIAVLIAAGIFYCILWSRNVVPAYFFAMIFCGIGMAGSIVFLIARRMWFVKKIPLFAVCMLVLSIFSGMVTWPFASSNPDQYQKQMRYLNQNRYITQYFPSSIPEEASNYHISFEPSFMGDGLLIVEFTCDMQLFLNLRLSAKNNAILSPMTLNEARDVDHGRDIQVEIADLLGQEYEEGNYNNLDIPVPDVLNDHPGAKVYVLRTNINSSTPRTEVAFFDMEKSWVCYVKQD